MKINKKYAKSCGETRVLKKMVSSSRCGVISEDAFFPQGYNNGRWEFFTNGFNPMRLLHILSDGWLYKTITFETKVEAENFLGKSHDDY